MVLPIRGDQFLWRRVAGAGLDPVAALGGVEIPVWILGNGQFEQPGELLLIRPGDLCEESRRGLVALNSST